MSSNPDHGEVYSIQHYVTEFVSDLWQVGGFLRELQFPQWIKLNWPPRYNWHSFESGVKHPQSTKPSKPLVKNLDIWSFSEFLCYLTFHYFDIELSWWRLYHKCAVRTSTFLFKKIKIKIKKISNFSSFIFIYNMKGNTRNWHLDKSSKSLYSNEETLSSLQILKFVLSI